MAAFGETEVKLNGLSHLAAVEACFSLSPKR
jgi:hypothetical protein